MNATMEPTAPTRPHLPCASGLPRGSARTGSHPIASWSAALSLFAAVSAAASAPPSTEPPPPEKAAAGDLVDLTPLDAVGAPCWSEIGTRRIYFAHASVGRNILDGVEEILRERPSIGLAIHSWRASDGSDSESKSDSARPNGGGAGDESQRAGGGGGTYGPPLGPQTANSVSPTAAPGAGVIAVEATLEGGFLAAGIDLALVEALTLLGVAENAVGLRYLLELLFDRLVAGIDVRMQLLGQLAVGALDVLG